MNKSGQTNRVLHYNFFVYNVVFSADFKSCASFRNWGLISMLRLAIYLGFVKYLFLITCEMFWNTKRKLRELLSFLKFLFEVSVMRPQVGREGKEFAWHNLQPKEKLSLVWLWVPNVSNHMCMCMFII